MLLTFLAVCSTLAPQDAGKVRVIDGLTGSPVTGAVVYGVNEADAPLWGERWFRVKAETGDDGVAELPLSREDAEYSWCIVEADGYGLAGESSAAKPDRGTLFRLYPAEPARVRIVDFLGRPVPLLHLGFCVGCGHTPDMASAVTDRFGRATLTCTSRQGRDIDDVFPVGAGVRTDYLYVDWDVALS